MSRQPGDSQAGASKAQRSEPTYTATSVEQLSRMMAMMAQQNDMVAQCMNEVRNMRANVVNLSGRVTEMETSAAHALGHRAARASTPENRGQQNGARHQEEESREESQASDKVQDEHEPPKRKRSTLKSGTSSLMEQGKI